MAAVGLDPERFAEARRDDIDTFVELHIEQGPRLEDEGYSVGVVTGITGIRHYVVELGGRSDHAGARPMIGRRDPMPGMAEIVLGTIGERARAGPAGGDDDRTHGRRAEPLRGRARPRQVHRRRPPPGRGRAGAALRAARGSCSSASPPRAGSTSRRASYSTCRRRRATRRRWRPSRPPPPRQGIPALTMHSGAGHDTQRMAKIARTAMVFVRSKDGRSHTPGRVHERPRTPSTASACSRPACGSSPTDRPAGAAPYSSSVTWSSQLAAFRRRPPAPARGGP